MTDAKKPTKEQAAAIADKLSEGWEYITIPDKDIFNQPFQGFWNNRDHYKPGTHLVPPNVAGHLKERLAIWQAMNIRLLQPFVDGRAQRAADLAVTS